ncbi:hypothetical protein [Streptomyces physcomitrii]|uniref:XRE family transcriptional regulator n=1 Tax=Streptomyces physcomitrii TaxID=2724184 RepID=A0ABX1GZV1_9ACTN|nr:hypothetical protein [Streptomyces physcomitrii]NKI41268.1 hypothetical protein [Streptomyces physcomitrii]
MPHAGHVDAATVRLEEALRTGPFALALRAALAARRMPLQRVQHHLARRGVKLGVTSLSYWQQGARRPQRPESLRAVRMLEEILQLPQDSLIRLLAQPGGRADPERPPARSYRAITGESAAVESLLGELDAPLDGGLHTLSHHEGVRIGARRELLERDSHHIVRAHKEGVDRYVVIHQGDPGCAPERVEVRALENCRRGRVRWDGDSGVVVAELLFDVRLSMGDTHVFRYGIGDGTAGEATEYMRGFSFAGGQYALQVRFTGEVLPVRCHRFARLTATAPPSDRRELTLSGRHRSVHLVETDVTTGILGIGWDWD